MPSSTASLESLSSPSPSPPPAKQRASPPAQSNTHDTAGLDSGSELSELTEDEQDSAENKSKASVRKQPTRRTRRSLVPDQMWGWYKKKSEEKVQKYAEQEEEEDLDNHKGIGKPIKVMEEEEDADELRQGNSTSGDQPPPPPTAPVGDAQQITQDGSVSDPEEDSEHSLGNGKPDDNDADDTDPDTDDVRDDEDDGEEGHTDSEEEDPVDGDGDAPDSVALSLDPTVTTPNLDLPEETTPMDVDIIPLTTNAAVASSSIMAGSTVIETVSPTSSVSSSRSPSPKPAIRDKTKREDPLESELADPPAAADEADAIVDEEDGDQELESDLQPAHRAEALDVLAAIELKFALLRERLYVEKMEALAWEESLLNANVHPELIHLDEELSKRRDKRLELASRRRAFEIADANKRKRVNEDAVWSWWKYERDELQTEMLSETNRKRRRLQRDSRSLERPLPIRRIPHIQHELPAPPTLRDLTRNMSYAYASSRMLAMTGAYPSLAMLPGVEVDGDLEFIIHHRRGWDVHRGNGQNLNHSFESYGPIEGASGYGILPSAAQPPANYPLQQHHSSTFAAHGRQEVQPYLNANNFPPPRSISPVSVNNNGLKPPNGWMTGPGVVPGGSDERVMVTKESKRDDVRFMEEREMDRERNHQLQLMHQQQQRHQHQQQTGGPNHHPHHHHHVVHHHHPPSAAPQSNTLSPRRVARDLEFSRPRSGPPPSTEVIDLSSSTMKRSTLSTSPVIVPNSSPHEAGIPRVIDHIRPSSSGYDREHPRLPPISTNLERVMTPFVIPPSQATQAHFSSTPPDSSANTSSRRDVQATEDLHRLPPSASHSAHLPLPVPSTSTPLSHIHSPSSMRPSNLSLMRPQPPNPTQNSSPRNNRLPLPPPLPSRSPGISTTPLPLQLPPQSSPQPFPTPAALMASLSNQNRPIPASSPKPTVKQVIDPALTEISGPGRSGLILNVVELRNPNPPSLHPSTLSALTDGLPPSSTSRMNGVPVDGS